MDARAPGPDAGLCLFACCLPVAGFFVVRRSASSDGKFRVTFAALDFLEALSFGSVATSASVTSVPTVSWARTADRGAASIASASSSPVPSSQTTAAEGALYAESTWDVYCGFSKPPGCGLLGELRARRTFRCVTCCDAGLLTRLCAGQYGTPTARPDLRAR